MEAFENRRRQLLSSTRGFQLKNAMSVASFAYLQVTGPDPKELKADRQAFASTSDGISRLSASGIRWDQSLDKSYILTPASLVLPFIRSERRQHIESCKQSDLLDLARFHQILKSPP